MDSPLRERAAMAACEANAPHYTTCVCKRDGRSPASCNGRACIDALRAADAALATLTLSDHIAAVEASGTHTAVPLGVYNPGSTSLRCSAIRFSWCDCKVAYGIEGDEPLWRWHDRHNGELPLPTGWSLCETDASGARMVAVFRVEGELRKRDGERVATMLRELRILVEED